MPYFTERFNQDGRHHVILCVATPGTLGQRPRWDVWLHYRPQRMERNACAVKRPALLLRSMQPPSDTKHRRAVPFEL